MNQCFWWTLAWSIVTAGTAVGEEPPRAYVSLFNGVDLDGWWGCGTEDPRQWMNLPSDELFQKQEASLTDIQEHWRVENGVLVNDGEGLYLTTADNYGDFELLLEYRTVPKADSGIYLRGCPQVQIWDTSEAGGKWKLGADKGSGGLWNNSADAAGKDPLAHVDRPFGEWNKVRVLMVGERVSVVLNDKLVVDHARLENYFDKSQPVPRRGPIQLQTHGGEIRWRRLYMREIPPEEANEILASQGASAFEPLFQGTDFSGWSGPVDSYEIVDGAMQCKSGSGGTIYADRELADFVARLEFQLPPGGNNGLAIRYPGAGDTAYVGMCELQVLDNTHEKYAALDARQYHGSAYGMAGAARGYLRPVGSWNFQEVTVQGSRIQVELNGTVILDADLSEVQDFLHEADKFEGRTRSRGYFGFAGHGDPVRFRNVQVRVLQ